MRHILEKSRLETLKPTASREALRQIIEVFREGHQDAEGLRETAGSLTPGQVERELEAIEERMLTRISLICTTSGDLEPEVLRH